MEFRGYFIFVQQYPVAAPLLCNAPYACALQREFAVTAPGTTSADQVRVLALVNERGI
jgi:hypothetical protein